MLAQAAGTNFQISAFSLNGQISWTNAFIGGVCTVEAASRLDVTNGPTAWIPQQNYFTTNSAGMGSFALSPGNPFFPAAGGGSFHQYAAGIHKSGPVLRSLAHHRRQRR